MNFYHDRRRHGRRHHERRHEHIEAPEVFDLEGTGTEAPFFRSLVDSRAIVSVVLHTGEELRGRIRYYDRDCFSIGPAGGGPKIFLRKDSVLYIREG